MSVVIPYLITDLINLHRGKIQIMTGLLNTQVIKIGDGRRTGLVMKQCIEARLGEVKLQCYIFYLNPLFDVFFHIVNCQIDHILFHFLMRRGGLTVQIQIFEGGQIIVQSDAGKLQVLQTVSHFQCMIELFEQVVSFFLYVRCYPEEFLLDIDLVDLCMWRTDFL